MLKVAKRLLEVKLRSLLRSNSTKVEWLKRVIYEEDAASMRSTYELDISAFQQRQQALADRFFSDHRVSDGPFKGLIYPFFTSFGSALLPKLAGTYENELHDLINRIVATRYDVLIDVGSAEGYYAVGLAVRNPSWAVFAYDSNATARSLCKEMITVNGVSNCDVRSAFAFSDLSAHHTVTKGLIILDCEGFERDFLSQSADKSLLKNFDLLIEAHDFLDHGISEFVTHSLRSTHNLEFIQSRSPFAKAREVAPIYNLTFADRLLLVNEERPGTMEWIWATSKS